MLIQFSVSNYRSIKECQTISLVTTPPSEIKGRCLFDTGFNAAPNLVESAAIYGPNGAGKSNLISAMDFFQTFVVNSAKDSQEGEPITIMPFLFSKKNIDKPSEFEVVFIHDGFLFQYGFSVDAKRVHKEWLYATPQNTEKQKPQRWFERDPDNVLHESTHIMKGLKGNKKVWQRATRSNALFLSTAVSLNSEDFKKPFNWIRKFFNVLPIGNLGRGFTVKQIHENNKKQEMLSFMKDLDASFDDVLIKEKNLTRDDIPFLKDMPDTLQEKIVKDIVKVVHYEIFTNHKTEEGEDCLLNFKDESDGNRRLFAFAGPVLEILAKGELLVVDEISNSLHPRALKGLVALFKNKNMNRKGAQLIFTTHDTSVMNIMERDQIWLMSKGEFGDSTMVSISEFDGRADEAVEKRYRGGRYGALPNIRNID